MTSHLPGSPVSVGRTVSCPLSSRHLWSSLLLADRGSFPNVRDSIPCAFVSQAATTGCLWKLGRVFVCDLNLSGDFLHVNAAVSSEWAFASFCSLFSCGILKRLSWAGELCRCSSLARFSAASSSLQGVGSCHVCACTVLKIACLVLHVSG